MVHAYTRTQVWHRQMQLYDTGQWRIHKEDSDNPFWTTEWSNGDRANISRSRTSGRYYWFYHPADVNPIMGGENFALEGAMREAEHAHRMARMV